MNVFQIAAGLIAASSLLVGCSGGDDDDGAEGPLFDPARADELAHAMMFAPADLPRSGWEVTAQDAFDDDDDDFDAMAAQVPECRGLTNLAKLGSIFGGDADDQAAGRAQIELQRFISQEAVPWNVELEVEIEETLTEVQGSWNLAKPIFESEVVKKCFPALIQAALLEEPGETLTVKVDPRELSATPPHNGTGMAMLMKIEASELLTFDMAFEFYVWPYSNALVTVVIAGDPEEMHKDDFQDIVDAADAKIRGAAD